MAGSLEALKRELEAFGKSNDGAQAERPRRMLNITRDTGEFLSVLVIAARAQRILEIGTSNGYSTLWLAEAAQATGGAVTTLERSAYKAGLAAQTFARSGFADRIALLEEEAGHHLERCEPGALDFIFLDAERGEYPGWWPLLRRALRPGGLVVADNALSHEAEMAPFAALVKGDPGFTTTVVPVGNGELLAVRHP